MKIQEKHALWLRVVHWFNVPMVALMIYSGLLIYWANDVYPGFFPKWFYSFFGLSGQLADGLSIHFFIGWFFVINGLLYLTWLFASGHWRELFPDLKAIQDLPATILHDMGLRAKAPPQGKFNAAQRLAYTSVIGLGIVAVLSGFAIYKPVQLAWLTACFLGYEGARLVHFLVMLALTGFIFMHVVQVLRAGWNNFRAMVAGFEVENEE